MSGWVRHPVTLTVIGVLIALGVFAAYLIFPTHAAHQAGLVPGAVAPDAHALAGLRVTLSVAGDQSIGARYFVAIEVEGDRTFTMPVRFIQGLKPVQVSPEDAKRMLTAWAKARATGIAQFGVISPDSGPTLLIDVDNPGAR
jgi:hypothetical protein